MILYLCSNPNINLFDFLDKERGMPIKKMSGVFKLKQFVIHDVKNLTQFSYLIIDLKALKDSDTEIIEAVAAFGTMYSARIILFAEGLDGSSPLILKLIDLGIYNIITSTDFEDVKEEMFECISPEGKDRRSVIRSKYFSMEEIKGREKTEYLFLCRDIKIAVVGAAHKVGTTTTAINLVNFLADIGAEVAYVEANANEHLKYLPTYYKDMVVNETYIEYKGINYFFKGSFPEYSNFTVVDFGTIGQCRLQALRQCELLILCGTTKPYELHFLRTALDVFDGLPLNVVLSHAPQSAENDITALLARKNSQLHFAGYSPDLFDGKANAKIFSNIVEEYMQIKPTE